MWDGAGGIWKPDFGAFGQWDNHLSLEVVLDQTAKRVNGDDSVQLLEVLFVRNFSV